MGRREGDKFILVVNYRVGTENAEEFASLEQQDLESLPLRQASQLGFSVFIF